MSLWQAMKSDAKQEVRERLADWFKETLRKERMNLLSLPGINWEFERIARPHSCVGLEWRPGRAAMATLNRPSTRYTVIRQEAKEYLIDYALADAPDPEPWNCVWLDLCAPLSNGVKTTLRALSLAASQRHRPTPIAVTLLAAREGNETNTILENLRPAFPNDKHGPRRCMASYYLSHSSQFYESWWHLYQSNNNDSKGSSMLVIAGELRR
jgi:hypothetical protein